MKEFQDAGEVNNRTCGSFKFYGDSNDNYNVIIPRYGKDIVEI